MPEKVVVKPVGQAEVERKNHLKFLWGIICLVGPTALFFVSVILAALNNFMFGDITPIHVLFNIVIFIIGLTVFITWLPGIIIGAILLSTRKTLQ